MFPKVIFYPPNAHLCKFLLGGEGLKTRKTLKTQIRIKNILVWLFEIFHLDLRRSVGIVSNLNNFIMKVNIFSCWV